ncbi:MAG TPA: FadR/GntR family transcriptional regulator [Myxococcota bacterium]|nr:FadR/GntR family transcriptional regulator [Myxococcota bacterium]
MPFAPIRKRKLGEQIAESIRDAILGGELTAGESLPSERRLADRFGVNRSSVREAVRRLEALGLVEVRHGGGTIVNDVLATAGLQILPFLIAPNGELDPKLLADLLDIRVALMGFTASRAARGEGPLDDLEALVEAMESERDPGRLQTLDFDFFELLVVRSDNRVLGLINNAVRRVYNTHAELFAMLYGGGIDTTPHRRTLEALRTGDADGARRAMEAHGLIACGGIS